MATSETESTDLATTDRESALTAFRRQDAAIAKLAEKYLPLKVAGINDRDGLRLVHDARMTVKGLRVAVEKQRKALKEEALRFGREVDSEAKRLTLLIEPIETHLEQQESAIADEKARLKQIEDDARQASLQRPLDALAAVGCMVNPILVSAETEPAFAERLAKATAEHAERLRQEQIAAEAKRKADEAQAVEMARREAALNSELLRLEAERKKQEQEATAERERLAAIQRNQDEEAATLKAEREALEREAREAQRLKELEAAKAAAAEQARIDTERRLAEQAAAEVARLKTETAARLKAESERPYREQLRSLADNVLSHDVPKGPMAEAVRGILRKASQDIRQIAENELD